MFVGLWSRSQLPDWLLVVIIDNMRLPLAASAPRCSPACCGAVLSARAFDPRQLAERPHDGQTRAEDAGGGFCERPDHAGDFVIGGVGTADAGFEDGDAHD